MGMEQLTRAHSRDSFVSDQLQPKQIPSALVIGNDVFFQAIFAGDKPFVFKRKQMEFLYALKQMKNIDVAAMSVGETEQWARNFLTSRKFKNFRDLKIEESGIQNSLSPQWWNQWGKWCANGKREYYLGECKICEANYEFTEYQIESLRDDDLRIEATCPVCSTAITVEKRTELFKPTREQVEAWKELGQRIVGKIERVNNPFEYDTFVFESSEEAH